MMDFKEFADKLEQNLKVALTDGPLGALVQRHEMEKMQGQSYTALTVVLPMSKKELLRTSRKPDCVTEIRMGNTVLVVSGYFKEDTTDIAEDKMMRVLKAEHHAGKNSNTA